MALHYKGCGLDNVWLESGYTVRETKYGNAYSIDDIDGLYQAISRAISTHGNGKLSGAELRFLRKQLNLSQKELASLLGRKDQTVAIWEKRDAVPEDAGQLIKLLAIEKLLPHVAIGEALKNLRRPVPEQFRLYFQDGKWLVNGEAIVETVRVFTENWHDFITQVSARLRNELAREKAAGSFKRSNQVAFGSFNAPAHISNDTEYADAA